MMKRKKDSNDNFTMIDTLKFLSKYILAHKAYWIKYQIGTFIIAMISVATPIIFGVMIDEIVYYRNVSNFLAVSSTYIFLLVFCCLMYFLTYAQRHHLLNMFTYDVKMDVFDHMQKADAQYLSGIKTGEFISIVQWYPELAMHLVMGMLEIIVAVISSAIFAVYLYVIDFKIGLLITAAVPATILVNMRYGGKQRSCWKRRNRLYADYISWVLEAITGMKDIRMLGASARMEREFEEKSAEQYRLSEKISFLSLNAVNIISALTYVIKLAIYALCAYAAYRGDITIGVLTVILSFYSTLSLYLSSASSSYIGAQEWVSKVKCVKDSMDSKVESEWDGENELVVTEGKIEFHDIEFGYDGGTEVLKGLSAEISAGERLALVGKSGCGKTTLAYMLIGFYRPARGYITIDSQKLSDCSLKSIRRNIGLIQQDVLLFDGTIRENILLGRLDATDEEIKAACESAGIWEFIETTPDGLDSVIGKDGIGVSGGQKQRIEIARIYLKNPKIIIFDEATSALDAETETQIHNSWKNVLRGRTAIVIAHRESSVMLCDSAAMIKDGKISAVGDPREMAANDDGFRKLFAIKEAREI